MINITQLLLCIAMFGSTHAQATIQIFEETFTGTIVKTSVIDPDNFDPDIFNVPERFTSQSTLVNGDITLTLFYPMFDFSPSHYPGAGTFTRTYSMGSLSGNFSYYFSLPDYSFSEDQPTGLILGGVFEQDIRNLTLPNTGSYQYSLASGAADGTITERGDITLKINWTVRTPDPFPVPEPESAWMFCLGLLMLGFRFKHKTL